jgi:DMSO/TMAO reductase YedYZ molybdopterin-dependent catalytic subunit
MGRNGATSGRAVGAWIGLLSGAVAVGVAELVAVLFGPGASPLLAVGAAAIDLSPAWLKGWAIETFGAHDKAVLLGGIGAVLALIAIVAGVASVRRPNVGIVTLIGLGAVGAAAAIGRPTNGIVDAVPAVVGTAAGLATFRWLRVAAGLGTRPAADAEPVSGEEAPPEPVAAPDAYDRRRFLRAGVAAGGLAVVAGGLGRMVLRRTTADASRAAVRIPAAADLGAPMPAAADLGVAGVTPFVTPNDAFYRVDTALFVPAIDGEDWRLRIHGMVDRELGLTFEDLLERPLIDRDVTLCCVSNPIGGDYIGNARWTGARLADLLDEAGIDPEATQLVSRSTDGFTIGTPTALVMDGRDAMLAVAMNGEPLPLAHGFPVRMLVPGLYGYVSAMKWLIDLELTTFEAYDAYWVQRGWAQQAPIKVQSRIDTPRMQAHVSGTVTIGGIAWAQHVGIARVEVRVDDGLWRAATLGAQDSIDTWRQWSYRWEATTPGSHAIAVRATTLAGEVQPEAVRSPFPDGATGYHVVSVTVD